MADAALALLPDQYIQRLSSAADFESFRGNSTIPAAVLITTKPASSPLFKSLSLRFKGRMAFAEAQDTAADVAAALSVQTFPKLVVIPKPGEGQTVHYDGAHTDRAFSDWLKYWRSHARQEVKAGTASRLCEWAVGMRSCCCSVSSPKDAPHTPCHSLIFRQPQGQGVGCIP